MATPISKEGGGLRLLVQVAEAGYHGLQCPRILAAYRSHAESMSHRTTNRSWYALSRTLQKRHPWLKLPLAQRETV